VKTDLQYKQLPAIILLGFVSNSPSIPKHMCVKHEIENQKIGLFIFLIPALWLAGAAASDANDLTAAADEKVGNLTVFEL
jgi:hypothetical protein